MRHAPASLTAPGALLVTIALLLSPTPARGQYAPAGPPPPTQEAPPEGAGQPIGPAQPLTPTPEPQAPAPRTQTLDPFAGSPLLQMFERQPDASAAPLQLRLAPLPEEPRAFAVRLSFTAEEEFTDNANQTKNDRQSEFRTRITPGLSVRADRPWVNLSLAYAPQVFIPDNSINATELNQNLSFRAGLWPGGRFQFNVADDFVDSNNWQDIQDPGARRTGTSNYLQNTVTAEAAYVLPSLRTALAYTNILNQEDIGVANPTTETTMTHVVRPNIAYTDQRFSAGAAYTLTRGNENGSISIPYWNNKVDGRFGYGFAPTITPGLAGSYEYQEPDIGRYFSIGRGRVTTTLAIGSDGNLDLGVGADVFALQGDSTEVRPSFLFAYTQRFRAFAVTARYEQGYVNRFSDLDNSGITFTRSGAILLTSSVLRDLTATLGVRYEENENQTTTLLGGRAGATDRTWTVNADLRYLLVRSLFLSLGYVGTFRTSTEELSEFNENIIRAGVTYQYDLF